MNEKENSLAEAYFGSGGPIGWGIMVVRLEASGWSYTPPAPPTPHWRDLPAGPELDRIVRDTFFKDERLLCTMCGSNACPHGVPKAAAPRSTDLALAMGMLGEGDSVTRSYGGWSVKLRAGAAQQWQPLPAFAIVRAKLAAHEAGR